MKNFFEKKYISSYSLFQRAQKSIPSQTQTFSKGWTQYPFGVSPIFLERADSGYVWDVDGNRFIDWPMALGPLMLGHNFPTVVNAVSAQLDKGIAFSLPSKDELVLAERLIEWFPYAERVRFGKNGSDATTGAVRLARAYTGREKILCCGYHGWHDWFIGTTTRSRGVPEGVKSLTISFPYNDIDALENLLRHNKSHVAAIIMEPMGAEQPKNGYLEKVRELSTHYGVVLIFDECWTGFRLHNQGSYGVFGVKPDLACFGKALGNGVPISAIVGRSDIMEVLDDVFFSFTFGGDLLGIAAANAVLTTLENEPVVETVEKLGKYLMNETNILIKRHKLMKRIKLYGYPARSIFSFVNGDSDDLLLKSIFQQEVMKEGILSSGWHAPSYMHTFDDIAKTLEVYDKVFEKISKWDSKGVLHDMFNGMQVQPIFRKI